MKHFKVYQSIEGWVFQTFNLAEDGKASNFSGLSNLFSSKEECTIVATNCGYTHYTN